jgi:peptidoglycan L-alanyl-D-glutamate endopeptidase CwlK
MTKENKIYLYIISLGTILTFLAIYYRKPIKEFVMNVWDKVTDNKINSLHPAIKPKVIEFINLAETKGYKLRITSGYRTYDEQNKLYSQGRTTKGNIVTNAKGGESYHNFGLAIDVVPIVNGVAEWNTNWNEIATIGKSLGFEWGGDFNSIKDKPHFEMSFNNTLAQLRSNYSNGFITNGYVNLA